PVLLRGAAHHFLPDGLDPALVDRWMEEGRAQDSRLLVSEKSGTRFIQMLVETPFDRLVAEAKTVFGWDDVWCDVIHTAGLGSIGSHFDSNDNFSIQLEGYKT